MDTILFLVSDLNFNVGIWIGLIIGLPIGFALSEFDKRKK